MTLLETVGLADQISSNPLGLFLVVVLIASLVVILRHSERKTKLKAIPFLVGSVLSLLMLYDVDFRTTLLTKLGVESPVAERLTIGIQRAGVNVFLWTPEMTDAFILGIGAAVVVWGTGSRKLGGLIACATILYLVTKAWAIIGPILQALH